MINKEGFAVQTPSPKAGSDPMFEKTGPVSPIPTTVIQKKFWSLISKELSERTGNTFEVENIIFKPTRAQITLINKKDNYLKSINIYQDWSKDKDKSNPITVLQLETEDGDKIERIGNKKVGDYAEYVSFLESIIDKVIPVKKKIVAEKAKSKQQQKFFAVANAMRKGKIKPKGEAGKVAKSDMTNKEIKKFASTDTKKLPKTVEENNKTMITEKERKLAVLLLKERLERLTGKKVVLKEGLKRVSIDELERILAACPADTNITLFTITPVSMNKTIVDESGQKIPNPYFDKVVKENYVDGIVNYDYTHEQNSARIAAGQKANFTPTGKSAGEHEGALVRNSGEPKLIMVVKDTSKPIFKVNGNEISKEELRPYLKPITPSTGEKPAGAVVRQYKISNIKSIVIGNDEYQII